MIVPDAIVAAVAAGGEQEAQTQRPCVAAAIKQMYQNEQSDRAKTDKSRCQQCIRAGGECGERTEATTGGHDQQRGQPTSRIITASGPQPSHRTVPNIRPGRYI